MGDKATILVVDDSGDVLNLVAAVLGKEHLVRTASDGAAALHAAFEDPRPDLILLDVEMPDVTGFQLCSTLKAAPEVADIPVIFLTANADPRAVIEGFKLGAIDYLLKPISPPVLSVRVKSHLELIAHRSRQDELLKERTVQLERTRLELIRRLGRAMEYHETSAVGNRVVRLGHYARALAQAAGARPTMCDLIMKAAPLHDIGKVGVPASVLRKASALTAPEREQMQRHPEIGAEIIGEHDDPLLKLARTLALTHHERWDGNGYPSGAKGADIPWAGRLMAIVDSFESMTATQFHREPRPIDLAADEIYRGAGRQFDPALVDAFRKALPELRRIHAAYADQLGDLLNLDFSAAAASEGPARAPDTTHEMQAMQDMRDADAERAQALAGAQARLHIERELAAAAKTDIVTRQAAIRKAEERAAREATLLAAAKQRIVEENDAARIAREQEAAEARAAEAARQARIVELEAIAAAEAREKAAEALVDAKETREVAEDELAAAAQQRKAAEARAAEAETAAGVAREAVEKAERALQEAAALRASEEKAAGALAEKAQAEALARELAQKAQAQAREAHAAAQRRLEAERTSAEAARERQAAEEAAAQSASSAAEAEAKVAALARDAEQAAQKRLAAAGEKARAEERLAAAAAEKRRAKEAVAGVTVKIAETKMRAQDLATQRALDEAAARAITVVESRKPRRAASLGAGFLLGAALVGTAGYALLPEPEVRIVEKVVPAPPRPEPKPVLGEGEAIALRLDGAYEKIPQR